MTDTTSADLKFTTWEEAAHWTVDNFRLWEWGTPTTEPTDVAGGIDQLLGFATNEFRAIGQHGAAGYILATGHLINEQQLVALLASKQRDYGHDNILRYGVDGVKVRISDKVCRLLNLLKRDRVAANESVEDSWLDIIGYSVIGSMLEDGTFLLPLAADVTNIADPTAPTIPPCDGWVIVPRKLLSPRVVAEIVLHENAVAYGIQEHTEPF